MASRNADEAISLRHQGEGISSWGKSPPSLWDSRRAKGRKIRLVARQSEGHSREKKEETSEGKEDAGRKERQLRTLFSNSIMSPEGKGKDQKSNPISLSHGKERGKGKIPYGTPVIGKRDGTLKVVVKNGVILRNPLHKVVRKRKNLGRKKG